MILCSGLTFLADRTYQVISSQTITRDGSEMLSETLPDCCYCQNGLRDDQDLKVAMVICCTGKETPRREGYSLQRRTPRCYPTWTTLSACKRTNLAASRKREWLIGPQKQPRRPLPRNRQVYGQTQAGTSFVVFGENEVFCNARMAPINVPPVHVGGDPSVEVLTSPSTTAP